MPGMPEPVVTKTLANRSKQIDAAVDAATTDKPAAKPLPVKGAPEPEKPGFFGTMKRAMGMGGIAPDGKDK